MKKSDGLGSFLIPRRPIKGMHYYSVFKDQPDFEAKLKSTARPWPCQHPNPSQSTQETSAGGN